MKRIVYFAPLVMVAACASSPEDIKPTYFSDSAYASQSCADLGKDEIHETDVLTALTDKQHNAHKTDTWGVIALGVPLSELSGSDVSRTLALEKGKMEAIHRVQIEKSCPGAGVH